ncbi:mitochondrial 37S ribosomal protein uS7m [Aspergillus lucknowensis]|uniref:Ribosomal protein S7 domain-containing protein n=1 Tax=Aspergillus lucknowensis TaxID=176173 RepID=A0ABR4LWG1_9EURO
MPPLLNLFAARTAVPALRQSAPRHCLASTKAHRVHAHGITGQQRRWNSNSDYSRPDGKTPEEAQRAAESMPHVSEEAAEINKIIDKEKWCDGVPSSPELEQGTMVSEILSRDKEAQKHAPKVFQDQLKKGPSGSRSFSTSARPGQGEVEAQKDAQKESSSASASGSGSGSDATSEDRASAALVQSMITQVTQEATAMLPPGLKFPAPESLPRTEHYRKRYESVVDQFTKLMMRDGKLSVAQKNMSQILDHLRSAPPPNQNPRRRLLPGPPAPQLPLNPIAYLTLIIDSVAPLIKLRNIKGLAGGGASVAVPVPLAERQRRRAAIRWIIDASDRRRDTYFATRVANELLAVAEGRSGVWEKKEAVYKLGIAGRAMVGRKPRKK